MVLDAGKGIETQTLKLFEVCREREIPFMTFINKWDRPGKGALELLDEIEQTLIVEPTPVTWPVGLAGEFKGIIDRRSGDFIRFERTARGSTVAPEEIVSAEQAEIDHGEAWVTANEEAELLAMLETGSSSNSPPRLSRWRTMSRSDTIPSTAVPSEDTTSAPKFLSLNRLTAEATVSSGFTLTTSFPFDLSSDATSIQ